MSEFHYYVSHGLGWATGSTLKEAVKKAFCTSYYTDMRAWLRNCQKDGNPGISFWHCRVPLSADESYKIDFFTPQVEGLTECGNAYVTWLRVGKKEVAWYADPMDRVYKLEKEKEAWELRYETAEESK